MNMKKILFYSMALSAMMLTACSNDEVQGTATDSDKVSFTATIAGQPLARAFDTQWESNDAIGITGTSSDKVYTNVKYVTTDGANSFAAAVAEQAIYYQSNEEVEFTAYYPWNERVNESAITITADTKKQANQKTFDFLWAQATGQKSNPTVNFEFHHKMAKVVITVKKGDDVSYDEVKAAVLSLEGFLHEGTFNVTTGEVATTPAEPELEAQAEEAGVGEASTAWTFAGNDNDDYNAPKVENNGEESVAYTLIVFPQEFSGTLPFTATLTGKQNFKVELDFTTANTNAGDSESEAKNEWKAGRQYNIGVKLNKTGLAVMNSTISPWTEAEGGDFEAK